MQEAKNIKEWMAEARQFEQDGDIPKAAAIYQQLVDDDPENQPAVARLLVMYRRLKDYRKELTAIDNVLAAYAQRDKDIQGKWLKEHPKAAGAGRSILKQLGGSSVSAFGSNRVVNSLQKRRELVQKRLGKPTGKRPESAKQAAAAQRKQAAADAKAAKQAAIAEAKAAKQAAIDAVKAAKAQAAAEAKAAAAAAKAAKHAATHPSLFIISLRYLAPLEKIDAIMPQHAAFLKKHYANGNFLVSGRQVPRTGGIIISRGKNREAVEALMKNDPFVKKKLASIDIVEFNASQMGKDLKKMLSPGP